MDPTKQQRDDLELTAAQLIEKLTRQRSELAGALLTCVLRPRQASKIASAALGKLKQEEGWK